MRGDEDDDRRKEGGDEGRGSAWICSGLRQCKHLEHVSSVLEGKGVVIWTTNVQNALKRGFRLSQDGYPITFAAMILEHHPAHRSGCVVSDTSDVIFGVRCVFGDRVGLSMG